MSIYFLSNPSLERFHKTADIVLGKPEYEVPQYEPVPGGRPTTERVVLVTGTPTSGRWPMKLQYRDEAATPPVWRDLDTDPGQPIIGWAIPLGDGESLKSGGRYKGMMVGYNPTDGRAVYACVVGGGDPSAVVQVTSTRVASIYYRSFRGTQFNEPTRRFGAKVEILVLDAADIIFPA